MASKSGGDKGSVKSLASKAFGPVADEFGNEIRPLGSEVGILSMRAVRALLKPVSGLVWGFEKVEAWLSEAVAPKVDKIPEEFRVEPKLIVAGPTLESMKYCGSEPHLRDLFANLLATAMDSRTADSAHPAFVEIVKQLSPDEARILKYIAPKYARDFEVIETYRTWTRLDENGDEVTRSALHFGPYSLLGYYAGCGRLRAMPVLIGNLSRLEIMKVELPREINKLALEELMADPLIARIRDELKSSRTKDSDFGYLTGYLALTALGEQFLNACVRSRNN
jgi:hypothetical protein